MSDRFQLCKFEMLIDEVRNKAFDPINIVYRDSEEHVLHSYLVLSHYWVLHVSLPLTAERKSTMSASKTYPFW